MKLALAATLALVATPSFAGCTFYNLSSVSGNRAETLYMQDYRHFGLVWFGRTQQTCVADDVKPTGDIYPVKCVDAVSGTPVESSDSIIYSSAPEGIEGPVILFDSNVWYAKPGCHLFDR